MRFFIILFALILLGCVFLLVVLLVEAIPDIRLRRFNRKLKKFSAAALVELALQSEMEQEYVNAITAQISNSDDLLRIGQEARSASVKAAARKQHCLLLVTGRMERVFAVCAVRSYTIFATHREDPR